MKEGGGKGSEMQKLVELTGAKEGRDVLGIEGFVGLWMRALTVCFLE